MAAPDELGDGGATGAAGGADDQDLHECSFCRWRRSVRRQGLQPTIRCRTVYASTSVLHARSSTRRRRCPSRRARTPWAPVDPIGEALHRLRVTGVFYCRTEAVGAWAVDMPAFGDCVSFHVVTAGECWVEVAGRAAGPAGRGRSRARAARPRPPAAQRPRRPVARPRRRAAAGVRHASTTRCCGTTGPGERAELVCGVLAVDGPAARPLLDLLPAVVHVRPARAGAPAGSRRRSRLIAAEVAPDPPRRRGRHDAARRHPRHPGRPRVARRAGRRRPAGSARCATRRSARRSPRCTAPGPAVDGRVARARGRDVTVRVRGPVHRGRRRARDAVRALLADARGRRPARARGEASSRVAAIPGYESEAAFSRAYTRTLGARPGRRPVPVS